MQAFADLLSRHSRDSDVTARLGGEEFAVLLPGTDASAALNLAEKIRENWRNQDLSEQGIPRQLTTSFGVAQLNADSDTFEHLMEHADSALYQAKRRGRDRSEVFSQLKIDNPD